MRIDRKAPWAATINFVMSRFLHAEAWKMALKSEDGKVIAAWSKGHGIDWQEPIYRQALKELSGAADTQRVPFTWTKRNTPEPGRQTITSSNCLFLFFCRLGAGETLSGGALLDQTKFDGSEDEQDLLNLLACAASGIAREIRHTKEKRAAHRLISSLAIDCVIVDEHGQIVCLTPNATEAFGLKGGHCEQSPLPLKAMTKQALAQSKPIAKRCSPHYHVGNLDNGSEESVPLYVLPISSKEIDGAPDFLALLLPRDSEPPPEEVISAILSVTLTEAKIVRRILVGTKVCAIAEEMSFTEQTVRTYLKRIYAKLGVSSQVELVAKVHAFSVPLGSKAE